MIRGELSGHQDQLCFGIFAEQCMGSRDSVKARHHHIHDYHVRLKAIVALNDIESAGHDDLDFMAAVAHEHREDPGNIAIIISNQHSHRSYQLKELELTCTKPMISSRSST